MAQIVKTKKFRLKSEATDWAKKQKKKSGGKLKWETNRITNSPMKWEAVLIK